MEKFDLGKTLIPLVSTLICFAIVLLYLLNL